MQVFIQIGYGIIGSVIISFVCIWRIGSFGEARHVISIIGAIAILIASLYILRSRWIRWGNRRIWLKYHQRLASLGLCLVLFHSAFQPITWHSWLTFLLALSNMGTGIAVSLTAKRVRQILLRCHLILAPILLIGIVFHGQAKLDHDEFFPLTEVHDVPCAKCHTSQPLLFRLDLTSIQPEPFAADTVPEDIEWWFGQHDIKLSQTAKMLTKEQNSRWIITDNENRRHFHIEKERHIEKEADELSISADNSYRSYTCITCHEHNTPELKLAHELHGVNDFHRCLVCHQTEIEGTKYGRQRVNWDYDPNW